MKSIIFTVVLCLVGLQAVKITQKSTESSKSSENNHRAIIAIRIVDAEGEKTNGKNLKRTIESALGYGYHNNQYNSQQSAPKYEIYKYSQHDIPAYTEPPLHPNQYNNVGRHQNEYQNDNLESVNSYQPGTTLFSTINQNGQISAFSQHAPTLAGHHGPVPIPVIILRILPSQLATSTYPLYPSLPLTDNFAPLINSIDIRSLLSKYSSQMQSYPNHKPTPSYEPKPIYEPQPSYQPQLNYQIQTNDQSHQSYQPQPHKSYQPIYNRIPQEFQNPQQSEPRPVKEEPSQDTSYNVVKSHVVHEEFQYQPSNQYLPGNTGIANKELLTHENYPSPQHTRVIFKTPEGQIRKTLASNYEVKQTAKQNDVRVPLQQVEYTHGTQQQQPLQVAQHQQVDYQYDSNQDYTEQATESDQYVFDESPTDKRRNIVYIPFRQSQNQQR